MVAPDRIYFLAKDPSWTWIEWNLSAESRERVAREAGLDPGRAPLTLRIHDLSAAGGPAGPPCFDVEVFGDTDHWYLPLDPSGHTYMARIGFNAADGVFHAIADSLPLALPPGGPSGLEREEWSSLPFRRRAAGREEKGYLLIVLNSHLPFVRQPELEHPLEENWLFEAIAESYIPLLQMISNLAVDGIRSGLTLSLSPTLLEMLLDPLLQARALRYAGDHARLADQEVERWEGSSGMSRQARMFRDRFEDSARLLDERGRQGLVGWFRELAEAGGIEIIASCASHAYLPLWAPHPESVELQVRVGAAHYHKTFGRPPLGFWLPECGFTPGVDEVLAGAGIRCFFLDAHGILNGRPRPKLGIHAPILCPAGVAAFGRDWNSHDLVWRKEVGYPGDPAFLDQMRDRGYDPDLAFQRCDAHASHFVATCQRRVEELQAALGTRPVLVALFDTEHFGHWWHEGPQWLNLVIRKLACDQKTVRLISATDYLEMWPTHQIVTPAASSWGYQGYSETWLMGRNHWIYPLLFEALDVLREIASHHRETGFSRVLLDQYIRELLLAQSSDWAFILHQQTVETYAAGRVMEHVENMRKLAQGVISGSVDESWLAAVRGKNNIFSSLELWETYHRIVKPGT